MDITIKIDDTVVKNAIISAFESRSFGFAYWAKEVKEEDGQTTYDALMAGQGQVRLQEINDRETDYDGPILVLDRAAIDRGVKLMSEHKNKKLFSRLFSDDTDAEIGEILIQFAVLGELKYG